MDEFDKKDDPQKLLEAYKMAAEMDESFQQDYTDEEIDRFLDSISMVESSGGKNFKHRTMQSGPHKGDTAIGHYGLMPNTIQEIARREDMADNLPEDMREISRMPSSEMKQYLESNPEMEENFARSLATKVINEQPNDEMAAYSWFQGHNKSPLDIKKENYENHDYVNKYKKFRKKLFGY